MNPLHDMTCPFRAALPLRAALLTLAAIACCSAMQAEEIELDANALLAQGVSWRLRLADDSAAIELRRGELFEDDGPAAGYSYQPNLEELSDRVWIRKQLIIPNPQSRRATLLVGRGGELKARVNGKLTTLQDAGKADNYWRAYALPPESLRAGLNTFTLSGGGQVWIARDDERAAGAAEDAKPPNRSARSADGGKTWDSEHLGSEGNIDGEYYVRVFLDHYCPVGRLTLGVLDLTNLNGRAVAPPVAKLGSVSVEAAADLKPGCQLRLQARFGPTPTPDGNWSAWQLLQGKRLSQPAGRYMQIEVEFSTRDPLATPGLKHITISSDTTAPDNWTQALRVRQSHNERIVRSSIPFRYEPFDHPRLRELRARFQLDKIAEPATNEFELMQRLARWSSRQWEKGHLKDGYPPWDALRILKHGPDDKPVGGFCQQYSLVFLQACECFGLSGRAVSLGPGGLVDRPRRGGHEVVEIWSNQFKKWLYIDGEFGWYAVDATTNIPLSLRELRERQLNTLANKPAPKTQIVTFAETGRLRWESLSQGLPFGELRLIPRSDFLQAKAPLPLNQGMRGWFWTGHYVWSDEQLPAALLYGRRVVNSANWDWTLNQAHYTLEATNKPGVLRVHLETVTPGFKTFMAEIDASPARPVASGFLWKLRPGENRLDVWPQNIAGRDGVASHVALAYDPLKKN